MKTQEPGEEAASKPKLKPRLESLADVARFMRANFPEGRDFPDREQPLSPQVRDLELDKV
jgi:hypothetical protein